MIHETWPVASRWPITSGRLAAVCCACVAAGLACAAPPGATTTPIQYVVVIYQENVSFDHYFATYPGALNPPGEPAFHARPQTPTVNGLSGPLLTRNPNAVAPFRLDRSRAATCDQDHAYTDEQEAYDAGLVDRFVRPFTSPAELRDGKTECHAADVMGFFDGNTVTALWNYAQHFAMSDAHFGTTFGPSTPGALNLVAGQTHGAEGDCTRAAPDIGCTTSAGSLATRYGPEIVERTIIGDPQPRFDDCSSRDMAAMEGPNVGLLLSAKHVRWGFFQGGFRPTQWRDLQAVCETAHEASNGKVTADYIPHHEPFQYYAATANPHHLPPGSAAAIGEDGDVANHQYDLQDFWVAADDHHVPQVSFLKASAFEDGHAGYSDPLAEQRFLVATISRLEHLAEWRDMAIFIAYDDSDGWYDHVMPPVIRQSATPADALDLPGRCGKAGLTDLPGRCGLGPRVPLILLSPYARRNFVDHRLTEQASILRFIEDNWQLGRLGGGAADVDAASLEAMFDFASSVRTTPLYLDPATGQPLATR